MNGKIIEVHGGAAPSSRWCGAIVALVIILSLARGPVGQTIAPLVGSLRTEKGCLR
jgi:hypothetical protein